ncbi:MAG: ABC transporter ATP-binding protein [Sulfolobales archaeon]
MVLEVRGVVKRFHGFELRIDSLVFEDKKYYVILGPSGSGKTTLLRILAGLEVPDEGSVILDGRDITLEPPWRRNIGIVFQNYALYPHMTAYDNIASPLRVKKLPEKVIREKILGVAKILGIEDQLGKYPHQMSGGQQQRVAIARALVKEPRVLLLDEPLSNLDARLRVDVRGFLKMLQRRIGTTIVHVTHDQEEALAIADEIVLINKGRIVEKGAPEDIYRKPKNMFTFRFLGLSNIVPPELLGYEGEELLGFRPEDAYICNDTNCDLEGVAEGIEYLGSRKIVQVRINKEYIIKISVDPSSRINIGERIRIKIDRDKIQRFRGTPEDM